MPHPAQLIVTQIMAGARIYDIAARYGQTPKDLMLALSQLDIETLAERSARVLSPSGSKRNQLIAAQLNAGASHTAVAKFHNLSRQTIHDLSKKLNVETPTERDERIMRVVTLLPVTETSENYVSLVS